MARKWKQVMSPKQTNDFMNCYHGTWMPQMDRCWWSDDGYQVMSRLLFTDIGKVEHVTIEYHQNGFNNDDDILDHLANMTTNGERDIPWRVKQQIKNELFGKERQAIEVFPMESHLVDVQDCYHMWILPKGYKMPFGIHPTKDVQCKPVNRGVPSNPLALLKNTQEMLGMSDDSDIIDSKILSEIEYLK